MAKPINKSEVITVKGGLRIAAYSYDAEGNLLKIKTDFYAFSDCSFHHEYDENTAKEIAYIDTPSGCIFLNEDIHSPHNQNTFQSSNAPSSIIAYFVNNGF